MIEKPKKKCEVRGCQSPRWFGKRRCKQHWIYGAPGERKQEPGESLVRG